MSKSKILVSSLRPFIDVEGLDPNSVVERKGFVPEIKIMDGEERMITAAISTSAVDADGDIVVPGGCDLSRYVKNNVVIWNHNYSEPCIGKALEIRATNYAVEAKIQFADTPRALEIWSLVKGSYLKSHSVGFITQESLMQGTSNYKTYCKEMGINEPKCKRIVTKWLLLEDSIVNLPSNPDALTAAISSKSISLSDKTIKELDLPVIEVKEVVEEVKSPVMPVGEENPPTIISIPQDDPAVVNLTVNDAVSILTLDQVTAWVAANGYKPLDKAEQTIQVGQMVSEERANHCPTCTCKASPVASDVVVPVCMDSIEPISTICASIPEKPKFIVIRAGDFKLTEDEKKLIAQDTLEEAELVKKALKRGRIV